MSGQPSPDVPSLGVPSPGVVERVLAAPPRLGAVRLVAVDGPSGSGKSCLADGLVAGLRERGVPVALVRTDHFATWDDPVAWWPRLVDGVLSPLAAGRAGRYRRVAWVGGVPRPGAWVEVAVPDVLVLEGVSAGRRSIAGLLSFLVWVELPDAGRRLARAVARDGEACREPLRRWQRFEIGWFGVDGTAARADLRVT